MLCFVLPSLCSGRIVETGDHSNPVSVEYGSDLDTEVCGSGFPSSEPWHTMGWNHRNLPILPESLFRFLIDQDISGVSVPWLYVGMLFSTFCW